VRISILAGLALSACTFSPSGLDPDPDATPGVDATVPPDGPPPFPPLPGNVVHVPEEGWFGGDAAVVWSANVTIDTTALTLTGPGTGGLTFEMREHDPPGSQIATLHLGDLTVASGVTVRVVGNRPLVVISSGSVTLSGVIDAGARDSIPGAGGGAPGQGTGPGAPGTHLPGQSNDSGGSGGGHATPGARGGNGCGDDDEDVPLCMPGQAALGPAGGMAYGDAEVTVLTGGSGGGRGGQDDGNACTPGAGGAGGGAVQLYAVGTIDIASGGGILAGGGGGRGGGGQGGCAAAGGGGGGAGGAIYLQAGRIELAGTLAANGGGGGAGATGGSDAQAGTDGALGETPAGGGPDSSSGGSAGGAGGAAAIAPTPGVDDDSNGGGGGGAVGYIVLHCSEFAGDGLVSPAPHRTAGCAP
jgi:hypothetical protein